MATSNTHSRKPRSVTIEGVVYPSMRAAEKALSLDMSTILRRIRSYKCLNWFYTEEGKILPPPEEIAELEKNRTAYITDEYRQRQRERNTGRTFSEEVKKKVREAIIRSKGRPVTIDGVEYETVRAAAVSLGWDVGSVLHRVRSPKFARWFYTKEGKAGSVLPKPISAFERRERMRYAAEEAECVRMWLDEQGAPSFDPTTKQDYSLIGRIQELIKMKGMPDERIQNDSRRTA